MIDHEERYKKLAEGQKDIDLDKEVDYKKHDIVDPKQLHTFSDNDNARVIKKTVEWEKRYFEKQA